MQRRGFLLALPAMVVIRRSLLRPPGFVTGGLVKTPTYALVGEAGSELIIPISQQTAAALTELHRQIKALRRERC